MTDIFDYIRSVRFQRPRKWLRISLRSALPAWIVLALLVFGGSMALRHAVSFGLLATIVAGAIAWRPARLRDALRRRIDTLATDGDDPGRPTASDGLNRAFERLVRVWRQRIDRVTRESMERPRIMDAMPDPVLLIDSEGRITRANRAARDLAGIDLTGHDIALGLRNPVLVEAVDRVLAGAGGQSIEIGFPVPVERHFAVRVEPLGPELPDAALVAFHDLTALEKTERMRADFIANVSHELKTPLASLVGYIETLRGPAREDAEARERFLGIMQDQADRMTRLVNDLLSLSRIELEEHTRPRSPVALAGLVAAVADGLAPQAARRKIEITLDAPGDLPPVAGDPDQLSEVFENLIDNALKYGREGGHVTVSARREGTGAVAVTVADDGAGIEAIHIPRLTERFYRVDADRSRASGGTGLGLAIVKHIVNRHRGRLVLLSEPGKGSRFTVTLPLAGG